MFEGNSLAAYSQLFTSKVQTLIVVWADPMNQGAPGDQGDDVRLYC